MINEDTQAVGAPIVILNWEEGDENQSVSTGPGESGIVFFHGNVTAQMMAGETVQDLIVTFYAETDQNWPTTVEPPAVQIQSGDTANFTVTVSVPEDACCDIIGTVIVGGSVRSFPGALNYNIPPIHAYIVIEQYYDFSLDSPKSYKETYPNENLDFELWINNQGNGNDTFLVRAR